MGAEQKLFSNGLINRRNFGISAFSLAVTACTESDILFSHQLDLKPETLPNSPQNGDIVRAGQTGYRLRDGRRYLIPDLEKYKIGIKAGKYKIREFLVPQSFIDQIPKGEVDSRPVFDQFSGKEIANRGFGELIVFFPGFITDRGVPYDLIKPDKDTFVDLREGIKPDWQLFDEIFFTYGERGLKSYKMADTLIDPKKNIENALKFFEALKKDFPLYQFNVIGFSLGGVFAMEVARKHWDAVNNLILIDSPIRGISKSHRPWETGLLKLSIKAGLGIDEKVTDYLHDIWDNNSYQIELGKFGLFFPGIGRGLKIFFANDDPIYPQQSARIPGATVYELSIGGSDLLKYPEAHGRALRSRSVLKEVPQILGPNLSIRT